uniref:Caspase family p20 domain-containing protein n=2 Tax=Lutzomyia longipalpis TaxID=7200 RepID=A0A1B0C8E6_LUTLO
MELGHREKITANLDQLIRATDYDNLMNLCLEKKILSQTMRENLEEEYGNEMDRKMALWRKIPKRGPKAYGKILEICSMHYPGAYRILCNATGKNYGQVASVSQNLSVLDEPDLNVVHDGPCLSTVAKPPRPMPELTPYSGPLVNHLNLTVKKSTKIHTNPKIKSYKMCSRDRGILFLINIINFKRPNLNRLGANFDRDNLIYLFNELGFTIYYYEDINPEEMFHLIESVITTCDNTECFVFGIMTHGNIRNHSPYVEFGNGAIIPLDSILEKFYNQTCYTLAMKPKIFLLPFC